MGLWPPENCDGNPTTSRWIGKKPLLMSRAKTMGFCAHATNARQLGPSDFAALGRRAIVSKFAAAQRTWNIGARWFRFGAAPILPKLRAFTLGVSLAPVFSNHPWSKLGKELDQMEDHPSAAAFSSSEVRRLVACDKDIDMTPKAGDTGMSRDMVQSIQHAKHVSQKSGWYFEIGVGQTIR